MIPRHISGEELHCQHEDSLPIANVNYALSLHDERTVLLVAYSSNGKILNCQAQSTGSSC
jgi:hypothetical protein